MPIHLRAASQQDLRALHALDGACFPAGIAYSRAEMEYFLSHPHTIGLIAEDEAGSLAGFILAERASTYRLAHIITIDVHADFRRRGVGRLLMETVESRLKAAKAEAIRLEVAVDNDAAQRFYVSLGYEVRGRIRGYYLGKLDALVMEKALDLQA
jgi:[ribosomal protein S18]-alanine N-acetyltransferase